MNKPLKAPVNRPPKAPKDRALAKLMDHVSFMVAYGLSPIEALMRADQAYSPQLWKKIHDDPYYRWLHEGHLELARKSIQNSREDIALQFDHLRGMATIKGDYGPAITATTQKAKVLGLMEERTEAPSQINIVWGGGLVDPGKNLDQPADQPIPHRMRDVTLDVDAADTPNGDE